ncbi:MAG: thioredoxin family protein [Bacteroidetes bacterium]|nr:thioredoxin family protein [Bacteroidota bacterium]
MKYFFSLAIIIAFIAGGCNNNVTHSNEGADLSPQLFSEKIKEMPEASIIDVRTPEEFESGHLQNALNIDWNGNNFETEISKLDKSKPVFVYCLSGSRSASAAKMMRSQGFKTVYQMDGGIIKWNGANLPVTTGSKPQVAGMTVEEFKQLTLSDKMVLIDFYADWCAPCKKMEPFLNEISQEMADKVVLVRINTDKNLELCKELKIDAIPVLQIYKNNALTWSNKGFISKEDLVKQLM